MSDGGEIYVTFGANTAALEASIASAKAAVTSLQRDLNRLGREQQATGATADSELGQKMLAVSARLTTAKGAVSALRAEMEGLAAGGAPKAASSIVAVSQAASHGATGVSFYTREIRALFDELGSGRDRQALGTFTNLAGHFLTANTALIPLVAAVIAIGGPMAYFAYEAYEAGKALESIKASAAVAQLTMTDEAAAKLRDTIKSLASVSSSEAADIARPLLAIGQGGAQIAEISSVYMPMLAKAMGEKTPEAAKKLAEVFDELATKGRAYVAGTNGVSGATIMAYDGYVRAGESGKAYGVIIDAMISRLEAAREAQIQATAAHRAQGLAATAAGESTSTFNTIQQAAADIVAAATAKIASQIGILKELRAELGATSDAQKTFAAGLAEAMKVDTVGTDIAKTTGAIKEMQTALGLAMAKGDDAAGVKELQTGLAIAADNLKKLKDEAAGGLLGGDALERIKQQNQDLANSYKGPDSGLLKQQLAPVQAIANDPTKPAKEREQAEQDASSLIRQIRDAEYEEEAAKDNQRVALAGKNSAQVVSIRQAEVARAIAIYGEGSKKAEQAEEELARAKEAAANRGTAAATKSAKDELAATETGIKGQIQQIESATQQKIEGYSIELKLKQMTEQQKLAAVLAALAQEKTAVDALYTQEDALAGLSADKKKQISDQEVAFNNKNMVAILNAQKEAATKSEQAWDSMTKSINSAFDSQINGLLTGTEKWHQAFLNVVRDLTEQLVKMGVNKLLTGGETMIGGALGLGPNAAGATGSVATTANTSALGVMTASLNALTASLGGMLPAVTTQTATTLTNTAATTTATAATTTGNAIAVEGNAVSGAGTTAILSNTLSTIANTVATDAAALAHVFGFATGTPMVQQTGIALIHQGEAIIPAHLNPFTQMKAFDTGAWSIPADTVAGLHTGEMVIPQRGGVAAEFRNFMAGGGFSGGGGARQSSDGAGQSGGARHTHNWNVNVHNANDPDRVVDAIRSRAKDVGRLIATNRLRVR